MANEGNKWWARRSKHGRGMLFSSPQLMWEAACEYFDAEDQNDYWQKREVASFQGEIVSKTFAMKVPYTWQALALYCHTHSGYFKAFRFECKKKIAAGIDVELCEDFLTVIKNIEEVIFTQQYSGATTGGLKEGPVMRYLKMADKAELANSQSDPDSTEKESFNVTLKIE